MSPLRTRSPAGGAPPAPAAVPPRLPAVLAVGALALLGAAAALGASSVVRNVGLTALMPVAPALAWWAFARAPRDQRPFLGCLAGAATLWLAGSLVWYAAYAGAGYREPAAPGAWDAVFLAAYGLATAGVVLELGRSAALRPALLDASVALAAGLAVGAALLGGELSRGLAGAPAATLVRPLFGLVIVALVASALLGAWEGLRLSVVLVGAGQLLFAAGSLLHGHGVETGRIAERWADAAWLAGALVSLGAAVVVIARADRPVRLLRVPSVPDGSARARAVLVVGLAALAAVLALAAHAYRSGHGAAAAVALLAAVWIGFAMALRARGALGEAAAAYARLDRANVALERAHDDLAAANGELVRANARVRAVDEAFEDLLALVDAWTGGGLAELVREAGDDVGRMLGRPRAARVRALDERPPGSTGAAEPVVAVPAQPSERARRLFRALAAGAVALVAVYVAAALAGAPEGSLYLVKTALVAVLAGATWRAFGSAPRPLRRMWALLAAGAAVWLAATLLWDAAFVAAGGRVPAAWGPWEPLALVAAALAIAGMLAALHATASLREAALDACVVIAAGLALGAALVGDDLRAGLPLETAGAVLRPAASLALLALIASAAARSWDGLPLSVCLVGGVLAGQALAGVAFTGDLVRGAYADLRLASVGLVAAAACGILAAAVTVLGVDRPVRLVRPAAIPRHGAGAAALLHGAAMALAVAAGAALHGAAAENGVVVAVGLAAAGAIGGAIALRARGSLRELERAYRELEDAHRALERTREELVVANDGLARANVELRSAHATFESLLAVVDERTGGALRELVEEAGEELAATLARYRAAGLRD